MIQAKRRAARWSVPLFTLSLALFQITCGGDDNGNGQQPGEVADDFSGRYQGNLSGVEGGAPVNTTLTLTLTQSGNQVSGTYSAPTGAAGTVTGTANGNSLNFSGVPSGEPSCPFTGSANLRGDQLTGQTSRADSDDCVALNQTFNLTRQTTPQPFPTVTVTPRPTPTSVSDCFGEPDGTSCGLGCIERACPGDPSVCTTGFVCARGDCVQFAASCAAIEEGF